MKIWVGFCLLWLMGRMAMAAVSGEYSPTSTRAARYIDFEAITMALEKADLGTSNEISHERDYTSSLVRLIGDMRTPEEFLRGGYSPLHLPVPQSRIFLSEQETEVYVVLAQRALYPQTKIFFDLADDLRSVVSEEGYVIAHEQRLSAQSSCFENNNFTKGCVVSTALREALHQEVAYSLTHYGIQADASAIANAVVELFSNTEESSVLHHENFVDDAAEFWLKDKKPHGLLSSCLRKGGEFTLSELLSGQHCNRYFSEKLMEESLSHEMKNRILRHINGPFSRFREVAQGLVEAAMEKQPYCWSGRTESRCRRRKILEDLTEWEAFKEFDSEEKEQLIFGLVYYWKSL